MLGIPSTARVSDGPELIVQSCTNRIQPEAGPRSSQTVGQVFGLGRERGGVRGCLGGIVMFELTTKLFSEIVMPN